MVQVQGCHFIGNEADRPRNTENHIFSTLIVRVWRRLRDAILAFFPVVASSQICPHAGLDPDFAAKLLISHRKCISA
ncbi:MAG: hypothetical protein K2I38_00600, partial [Duncaniella sp.]|nr:hypothetical protein [Duncaniella sp.]